LLIERFAIKYIRLKGAVKFYLILKGLNVTKVVVLSYVHWKSDMNILTHNLIDNDLCGNPLLIADGYSKVELKTTQKMAVDSTGLIHGGFVFGLADYSAMIAVNHPNVVLGAADVKFIKPVKSGDILISEARVEEKEGKKQTVSVIVTKGDTAIFKGMFTCFILDKHVLIN
jgi:acyl-coenzyme A thioesterase PaaI-like protein